MGHKYYNSLVDFSRQADHQNDFFVRWWWEEGGGGGGLIEMTKTLLVLVVVDSWKAPMGQNLIASPLLFLCRRLTQRRSCVSKVLPFQVFVY